MSCETFDPKCPGCRPAILDPKTKEVLGDNHPVMKAVNEIWDASPLNEQEAYWRVTVRNSRDSNDLRLTSNIIDRIQRRMNSN
jgi:hypothetical protein